MKRRLKRALKMVLGRRILAGPFRGMRFLGYASTSVLMPKIIGTYEMELHPYLERSIPRLSRTVVVIGAGEGFYAIGIPYRNTGVSTHAFELDPAARDAMKVLAELNRVCDRVKIDGGCDVPGLRRAIEEDSPDLLVVDVEGYERELLDPALIPALRKQPMLVEVHDSIDPSLSDLMRHRFQESHQIDVVPSRPRTPADVPQWLYRVLSQRSATLSHMLLWERVANTGWMILTPHADT